MRFILIIRVLICIWPKKLSFRNSLSWLLSPLIPCRFTLKLKASREYELSFGSLLDWKLINYLIESRYNGNRFSEKTSTWSLSLLNLTAAWRCLTIHFRHILLQKYESSAWGAQKQILPFVICIKLVGNFSKIHLKLKCIATEFQISDSFWIN